KERDPVEGLARRLRDAKELSDKARTALEDRLSAEIDGAVEAAEQAPDEPVEDLLKYVTSPVGVSRP
ncbi:pyruvate dehydrogenase (acetyl-transferring) E1 component subunit alpha, partial [Streptomyces mirabilis]